MDRDPCHIFSETGFSWTPGQREWYKIRFFVFLLQKVPHAYSAGVAQSVEQRIESCVSAVQFPPPAAMESMTCRRRRSQTFSPLPVSLALRAAPYINLRKGRVAEPRG